MVQQVDDVEGGKSCALVTAYMVYSYVSRMIHSDLITNDIIKSR